MPDIIFFKGDLGAKRLWYREYVEKHRAKIRRYNRMYMAYWRRKKRAEKSRKIVIKVNQ